MNMAFFKKNNFESSSTEELSNGEVIFNNIVFSLDASAAFLYPLIVIVFFLYVQLFLSKTKKNSRDFRAEEICR